MDALCVAALEQVNYASVQALVQVTPGSRLVVRDDAILLSARLFPTLDMNHASLLRSDEERIDALLSEIVSYYRARRLPVNVALSPACTPPDLEGRLLRRGFHRREGVEEWLTLNLVGFQVPAIGSPRVECRRVSDRDAGPFARVYLASFGLPVVLAPLAALLLRRSLRLQIMRYYVALHDGRPAGVCLWHSHGDVACLGAVGVLPAFRGDRVATSIVVRAVCDAQEQGLRQIVSQTLYPALAHVARSHGFELAFTRTYYAL